MSYTIEYNKKVYRKTNKEEPENSVGYDDDLLLLIRQGDNNCRETSTGLRVKDWDLISYGWEYSVVGEICRRAGDCEGGSLQKAKGFESERITPEDYIAMYRKKIEKANPIENLLKDFKVEVMVYRKEDFSKKEIEDKNLSYDLKIIDKLLVKYRKDYSVSEDYYNKDVKTYRKVINSLSEFYEFLGLPRWNSCKSRECYNSFIFTLIKV